MKKASLFSAFLGTLIEVYDFTIFPLLFPILSEVFFSSHSQKAAMSFTILAYLVSYVVKPLGSLVFGCFIDRFGQKGVLLFTTVLMTLATSAIALMPSNLMAWYYGTGLIVCRVIQGLAISGEFSSAMILAVGENRKYPAFSGSLAFMGGCLGLLLAKLSIYILLFWLPHEKIIDYAWRVPFLLGTLGCLVLLLIRRKIKGYTLEKEKGTSSFKVLVKDYKRELGLAFMVSSLSASAFYTTFIVMPTFLSTILKLHSHKESILITLVALFAYLVGLPLGGILADKIGIFRQVKIASWLYLLTAYAIFSLIPQIEGLIGCMVALVFFAMIQAFLNGALPAFMVNQFLMNQRGKALALSYNISLTLFGGLMPYLILTSENHLNPGIPISICAGLCLLFIHNIGKQHGYLRSELEYR